jgi:hypothetical protein
MPYMPKTRRSLSMRSRQRIEERKFADYKQAVSLLRHDLVWSDDFDNIRLDLAELIDWHARTAVYPAHLTEIVQKLIAEENDLSI